MVQPTILEKLEQLPESLQVEVLHYIEFLADRYSKEPIAADEPRKKRGGLGILKGQIWMSDDFDKPLEEMKEYME
ncbi:DUF2281 domain-containing protein [Synechococcus elongatus IITB7]|uniref:type II toxin-antitoxin system VapB family antitoxin n=1 Tax=Synechococcus elongatus TaxID=32046 RepID=UPI0030D40315